MTRPTTRKTILKLGAPVLASLWLALCPAALDAQQHPNVERGFAPEKLYQFDGVDNVNILNGNVVLTIPIGMAYPAGGSLSYALTLTYNAKLWDIEERASGPPPNAPFVQALPNRRANAGFGWQLSMGRLVPPFDPTNNTSPVEWVYVGPDGAEHVLHNSFSYPGTFPQPTGFSKDGSFLRLRHVTANVRELDFPDGSIHRFDSQNRLVEVRDRFSVPNRITVVYGTNLWTISDGFGRAHNVHFVTRTQDGVSVQFVDRVELVGFGGGAAKYVYRLTYVDRTFPRANGGSLGACYDTDPQTSQNLSVPFLEQLELPDGTTYQFSYYQSEFATSCRLGAIAAMRLPTRGKIEWDYAGRLLPTEGCEPTTHWAAKSPAVSKRRQRDAADVLLGEWSYSFILSNTPLPAPGDTTCGQAGETLPREQGTAVVTSPLGHRTTHYFSVWPNPRNSFSGFQRGDYGLPFTRLQPGDGSGRFLSRQTSEWDASANAFVAQRSEYVRYEADFACSQVGGAFQQCMDRNRRVASQRTTFNDDSGYSVINDLTDYDGFGHYRRRTTTGTFPAVLGATATETNRETHTQWTSTVNASTWILNTSDYEWGKENGSFTHYAQNCYAANTPFLTRRRVHVAGGGSPTSANDLLVVYDHDNSGNVTSERYYGGDAATQALQLASACTMALPAAPQYRINHGYQRGALATSQYSGATFKHLDRTIDVSGLISSVRDSAGIQTDFQYDGGGRRTWEKPANGHDGWVEYAYVNASGTAPASVQVRRRGNGTSGSVNVLANELYVWDALGRLTQEQTLLPSGQWSKRITLFDAAGNVASASELHTGGAPKVTSYQNYDAFGRPRLVVPPDGTGHQVVLAYLGARQTQRTMRVGTAYNPTTGNVTESDATTTEIYDIHGRLAQLIEPNGVDTTYRYDGSNRLRRVCQNATAWTCGQQRHFTYDNRGFLTSEQHPEKGTSGNGTVTYSAFDARGHAGRRVDGPFNLTFSYDFAERLTAVREGNGAQRTLKQYTYATANSTGEFDRGKKKTATRFNYVTFGTTPYTVELKETYTYGGRHGRVSARAVQSSVNSVPGEAFTQGWSYTPLGNVDVLTYPRCTHGGNCTGAPATSRTVSHTYDRGFLTAVPGYATSISYHPNQTVSQVVHANGVQWNQAMDPNHIRRPASISTALAGQNWSSGSYVYDGAGNVKKIGNAYFVYDNQSRLKTANLFADISGTGTATQQGYTYDHFGNLTGMTGASGVSIPTSNSSNRLTGSVTYDSAGNLTSWNGNLYDVDAFGMMWRYLPAGQAVEHVHLYTADDERLWTFTSGNTSRWTVRDLDGRVLREFGNNAGTWSVQKDYVFRGSTLLAAVQPNGQTYHLHPDHLGTPRLITNAAKAKVAYHVYYPYGQELSPINQDGERMKYTGHERDLGVLTSNAVDLDYMHARFCNPRLGRFMSVDPVLGRPGIPQSWNRYAYTINNPLKYVDPDGRSFWRKGVQVIKVLSDKEKRTVLLSSFRGKSQRDAVGRTRNALDQVSQGELDAGVGRVVEVQNPQQRDAVAGALSTNGRFRGPEKAKGWPEHVNPAEGPYSDVHVQVQGQRTSGSGRAAAAGAVGATAVLGEIFSPTLNEVIYSGDPTPTELATAAAWDVTSTIDPFFVTDLIGWAFGLP